MPKPEFEFFDPEKTMEWMPVEGVDKLHEKVLAKDEGGFVLLEDFAQPGRPIISNSLDVPSEPGALQQFQCSPHVFGGSFSELIA